MGSGFTFVGVRLALLAGDEGEIVQVDVEGSEERAKVDVIDLGWIERCGRGTIEVDTIELLEPDSIELPLRGELHVDSEVVVAAVGRTPHRRHARGAERIGMRVGEVHAKGRVGSRSARPE